MNSNDMKLSRRDFVNATVAASTALALPSALLAQAPADAREPTVWLNMTQEELDAAYNQRTYSPNMAQVLSRWRSQNVAARGRLGEPEVHAYGDTAIETLQVYRSAVSNAPLQVFVHGGAWQSGSASNYAFVAEPIVNAGGTCVLVDFASMNDDGIRLTDMCRQVRDAVAWVYRNANRIGGDRERIYVSGHSSGGHLAGVIMTTDWKQAYGLPADTVRAGACISGIFDLEPVRLSHRNGYLNLTDEEVELLSTQRQLAHLNAPVIVAYGSNETPEFQRQSRDFAAAVEAAGKPVSLRVAEEYNHFEILETYANPYGVIGRTILEQMGLAS